MLTRREFIHTTAAAAAFERMPRLAAAKNDLLAITDRPGIIEFPPDFAPYSGARQPPLALHSNVSYG